MGIIVQKYGGSSVGSADKIKNVADFIIKKKNEGNKVVVVVSAMGDTTDDLLSLADQISENPDKRELDALLSTGEMISSSLLAMALKDKGCDSVSYNAFQIGLKSTEHHGRALIVDMEEKIILKSLKEGKTVIVCGFQGVFEDGSITTLGRGGSDTTAVALACKLGGECEIYTDVSGIYTVDPRVYSNAKKLDFIDYEEILELSSLGAQVMHSRSIEIGQKYGIPIYVGLSCSDIKGTIIKEAENMNIEEKPITGLATSDSDLSVTISNLPKDADIISSIFQNIADRKINVDMICKSTSVLENTHLSFTVPKADLEEIKGIIGKYTSKKNMLIDEDITKFSAVGIGMKTTSGVAAKIFKIFSKNGIEIKMITTSEIRITIAIKRKDKEKAVKLVAEEFNL
ncbi:MAG: aspartate kinase [Bacillota bacterium]|nr:aspartate kinase [Bacillota bacterium]